MRRLRVALSAFTLLVLAGAMTSGVAPVAMADTTAPTDLYVDSVTGCSDSGPGSQAVPFCTVQAAANVVEPGQTVHVNPDGAGSYGAVHLTRSGTPTEPITFTGAPDAAGGGQALIGASAVTLLLQDVHDVRFTQFNVSRAGGQAISVIGSSDITLDRLSVTYGLTPVSSPVSFAVGVDGASSGVTVSRTKVDSDAGEGIQVAAGARNVVLSSDLISATVLGAIEADGVNGLDITGDSLTGSCGPLVQLGNGTSGVIENDLMRVNTSISCSDPNAPAVTVDAASAGAVTSDYNAFTDFVGRPNYGWAGTAYPTPSALNAATGQAAHDLSSSLGSPLEGPVLTDSGNADAPGELSTDVYGHPRVDDPQVANSGAGANDYTDRGAIEAQDTIDVPAVDHVAQSQAVGTLDVTLPTAGTTSSWGEPLTFSADFGDGTPPVTGTPGPSVQHTYTAPGRHNEVLTVTDSGGSSNTTQPTPVVVGTGTPAVPTLSVKRQGTSSAVFGGAADFTVGIPAQDAWEIVGCSLAFGDTSETSCGDGVFKHDASPGTHTAKVTLTDLFGRTSTATETFQAEDAYLPIAARQDVSKSIPAHGTITLSIATLDVDWVGVDAVELRVTASGAKAAGSLVVYPASTARPVEATLAFAPGQTTSNQVTERMLATSSVSVYNSSSAAVTAKVDTIGTQTSGEAASTYTPSTPTRLLDTRTGTGGVKGPVASNHSVTLTLAGAHGIPSNASAVVLNVGATAPTAAGSLEVSGEGSATALYWTKGQTRSGLVTVPVVKGKATLKHVGSGTVQLLADLVGWYGPTTTGSGSLPITQARIVDSAKGTGMPGGKAVPLASHGTLKLKVTGAHGVPASDVTAADLNITIVSPSIGGYLVAYADGTSRPAVSSLNWPGGPSEANQVIVKLGSDGEADLYNAGSKAVNLLVDLRGAYVRFPVDG